jgi:hypothetical protein
VAKEEVVPASTTQGPSPKPFSLPHGASGIEIGDLVIQAGKDKVVVLAKGRGEHYTLQAGHASGVLDIHRTLESLKGNERHQTVFAIHRADLADFLNDLMPMTTGMLRLVRRLRLGWLYRNDIGIVMGLEPVTDEDMAAITRRQRKRVVGDEDKLRNNIQIPEYLEDIWAVPDGVFSLVHRGRKIGIGIKATDHLGHSRLYWFKLRDVSRFFATFQNRLVATASKYAIPKERHTDYGILQV